MFTLDLGRSEAIAYSFGALSATLLYFDLRSRHEEPILQARDRKAV